MVWHWREGKERERRRAGGCQRQGVEEEARNEEANRSRHTHGRTAGNEVKHFDPGVNEGHGRGRDGVGQLVAIAFQHVHANINHSLGIFVQQNGRRKRLLTAHRGCGRAA